MNTDGLDHYKKHGYKGKFSSSDGVLEELKASMAGGPGNWNTVKYTYNRGTMHDGDFPHLATPIISITGDKKRVIMGLNCFPNTVGECCMRAPEHSQAFNRTVKLYQTLASLTGDKTSISSKYGDTRLNEERAGEAVGAAAPAVAQKEKGFSVTEIKKNPALKKLLLTAAKKVSEFREKQKAENQNEL